MNLILLLQKRLKREHLNAVKFIFKNQVYFFANRIESFNNEVYEEQRHASLIRN